MPFIRTCVHHDTPAVQRAVIVEGIDQALVEAIGMPSDELFNRVTAYQPEEFFFSETFNVYARTGRPVGIEITILGNE